MNSPSQKEQADAHIYQQLCYILHDLIDAVWHKIQLDLLQNKICFNKGVYTNIKIIYDIAPSARTIKNRNNLPDPTIAIFVLLDNDLTSDELLKIQCLEEATSSLALARKALYI